MKKLTMLTTAVILFVFANAQIKRSKDYLKTKADSNWIKINQPLNHTKTTNGNFKVYSKPGKFDLYATYKNGQPIDFYALDSRGNKLPITSVNKTVSCFKCTGTVDDKGVKETHCWDVDCNTGKRINAGVKAD